MIELRARLEQKERNVALLKQNLAAAEKERDQLLIATGEKAPAEDGARIKLIRMASDDPLPIEPGATGVVRWCAWLVDRWQVVVTWDNKRGLNLVVPPDEFEVIE